MRAPLDALSAGACWYCETPKGRAKMEVDHFRPKGRIQDIDYNPIDPQSLNLPYVPLGDSSNLKLGDDISILGYPSIGGETITLTSGEVSGFTTETGFGIRAFIKTSAHGGVLPVWLHGSRVTKTVASFALLPACAKALTSACASPAY